MKLQVPEHAMPEHGQVARVTSPVICYPVSGLAAPDLASCHAARDGWERTGSVIVPPREARCFEVAAGEFFRISSVEGPQVDDEFPASHHCAT